MHALLAFVSLCVCVRVCVMVFFSSLYRRGWAAGAREDALCPQEHGPVDHLAVHHTRTQPALCRVRIRLHHTLRQLHICECVPRTCSVSLGAHRGATRTGYWRHKEFLYDRNLCRMDRLLLVSAHPSAGAWATDTQARS
jgi:hypothetical protein